MNKNCCSAGMDGCTNTCKERCLWKNVIKSFILRRYIGDIYLIRYTVLYFANSGLILLGTYIVGCYPEEYIGKKIFILGRKIFLNRVCQRKLFEHAEIDSSFFFFTILYNIFSSVIYRKNNIYLLPFDIKSILK